MEKEDRPHYHKHRERLRERFRLTGLDGFKDYEALELLLTYAIPRKDVKPIAKELIARFGGFQGVLDASYEELISVNGIKENSATFIKALRECATYYLRAEIINKRQITSTRELLDYCTLAMGGLKDEQFRVIFLNSQNEVIADEALHEGTVNHSVVYPRKVIERALYHKATALIFVHNHPGGSNKPSSEDKRLTSQLLSISMNLGIKILDHLIISKSGYYSFHEGGLL